MKYSEAIKYLYDQLPMYQRIGAAAYKNNLDNTLALDAIFGHPHRHFKSIHVAGTNGKGSVSHMLASVLQSAGYKVGLYTSPHLKDYRERIKINGEMMPEDAVCLFLDRFIEKNKTANIQPSFFELSVLMAFDYFAHSEVDFTVIEVGLGGRLDSTNVITPLLSIITNISLDHTNLLGNTIEAIAGEKAGIIKEHIPVIIGEFQPESAPVFIEKAKTLQAPISFADNDYLLLPSDNGELIVTKPCGIVFKHLNPDLKGNYQQKNLLTVIAAIEQLRQIGVKILNNQAIQGMNNVITNTGLLGRWQQLKQTPLTICDTAHNEAGIKWVVKQIEEQEYQQLHMVYGAVNDKAIDNILQLLPKNARYYFTRANIDRALDAELLKTMAEKYGLVGKAFDNVSEAYQNAIANALPYDMIFIGGSTFVVAELI